MNEKLEKYIIEIRNKYKRKKKSNKQKLTEFEYKTSDELKNKYSDDSLQVKKESSILIQNKKKKKRKKTKKKRLDARRIEFVKKLKQKFPEITENEINNRLDDYTKYESKILEDDIEFNKRLRNAREKLEKECDIYTEFVSIIYESEDLKRTLYQFHIFYHL